KLPKAAHGRLFLVLAIALVIALLLLAAYLPAGSADPPDTANAADSMLSRLGAYFEKQPRDARAWVLHARRLADAERFAEAAQAYENAFALPSKVAKDPAVWCEYADALAMTQQRKLAGKPRELIERALALNPDHPKALELAGSAEYEQGNYALALRYWRPLLALLKPGTQMHGELAAAVARTERLAGMSPQRF
ncbi:MAG: hypothetical protein NTY41_08120, partial [Proteobacteria bacterium]|nr:hypothetical protein [Pseudomonadota bacterium]